MFSCIICLLQIYLTTFYLTIYLTRSSIFVAFFRLGCLCLHSHERSAVNVDVMAKTNMMKRSLYVLLFLCL